jgi:tetratricopeptide (TPR) repeat protein
VLARSARRSTTGRRTTADGCAQAWVLAIHASETDIADRARRELTATCRASRDLPSTRAAYDTLIAAFEVYPRARAQAHYDLAMILSDAWQRGDGPTAEESLTHFELAATGFGAAKDAPGIATTETDRALIEFASGATDAAVSSLEAAQLRWRSLIDVHRLAETLLTLGDCLDAADQPAAAIRRYREAEVYFCEVGDGTSANAAAVRAELVARRAGTPGVVIDLRQGP